MRAAILSASLWLVLALVANAGEPPTPNAIYRYEIRPSFEKLNLVDSLSQYGALSSFTRAESDGSISWVLVFSDDLATYLAALQMPIVALTFEVRERTGLETLTTIHGKSIGAFQPGLFLILKQDQNGKAQMKGAEVRRNNWCG